MLFINSRCSLRFTYRSSFYYVCKSMNVAVTQRKNPEIAVLHAIRHKFWRILIMCVG
ncbi:uncharacterized protein SOCG_06153 [Schizosaccharomyces octosporus yFS286]|uniref:Uncharacterized protein n=1 Tax=Schizosaccharomyces octosporus (strain yFS286) TaxID=483514 RepID=S9PW38_SCHOY|nr:uncharacterized protein SOCG_06153 [Schizosaccharomyces octosporus yFS286]EPX71688.1 hypothetical protein SOCG_06153 [Schizosaccharomyces octosporus yFS286]